jgi:hypothetical protein
VKTDPISIMRRRLRATKAALAMHAKHPGMAREAGRKGAAAQMDKFGGPRLWGWQMAQRRWSAKRWRLRPVAKEKGDETATLRSRKTQVGLSQDISKEDINEEERQAT